MHCPACNSTMDPVATGEITVDVCHTRCGGIWFDHRELQRLDEPHEPEGELLIALDMGDEPVDESLRRACPVCPPAVMMRRFYSPRRQVEVDECPACGGFFLDRGELAGIRGEFAGHADRRAAIKDVVKLGSEDLAVQYALAREQTSRWTDLCRVLNFRLRPR